MAGSYDSMGDRLIQRFIAADEEMMRPMVEVLRRIEMQNTILKAEVADLNKRIAALEKRRLRDR